MSGMRAGERLAIVRHWLKFSRSDFQSETGISASRLFDLERLRQKVHDTDIQAVCSRYPEVAEFVASGGPTRLRPIDLILLKAAATLCELDPDQIDSVRTRLIGILWTKREEEEFGEEFIGKIARLDYYRESSPEAGTKSFAVAVLKDIWTYCESGLLILSNDGELESEGSEGRKLRSLQADSMQELYVRPGTKEKAEKLYEIWESDLVKT